MCYIKTGKNSDASNILNELVLDQSTYKDQANKILRQIED
jgi:hypothetical protein